ncbi:MAG: high-potential iron-sulfur protein [Methanobacteriota archaeon]
MGEPGLHCKDCVFWYGAEDDEYGPCSIKHQRGDARFVTYGSHGCDEKEGQFSRR